MSLSKRKLGEIISLYSRQCEIENLTPDQVSGINREKEFFEPSRQVGKDTYNYQVVPPGFFACNLMHVGRDRVLPIAYNHSESVKYVSPAYTIFSLRKDCDILDDYLFILLKSDEKDRYFWFHSDSSIRDGMSWSDFCDIEITVPDIQIQQKYIDVYNSIISNQQSYERGLEDLKLVCDGYIENLRREMPSEKIGQYLELVEETNGNLLYGKDDVRGISVDKTFIDTKANLDGVALNNYKIVNPGDIAYVSDTSRRGDKISLGLNNTPKVFLVSSISIVFRTNPTCLLPEYLLLWLSRSEFDRYARFNSWGSAREVFDWDEMCNVQIPIPDIKIQKAIVDIYNVYNTRKRINEQLKARIKDICPILIRGSLEEGMKCNG